MAGRKFGLRFSERRWFANSSFGYDNAFGLVPCYLNFSILNSVKIGAEIKIEE